MKPLNLNLRLLTQWIKSNKNYYNYCVLAKQQSTQFMTQTYMYNIYLRAKLNKRKIFFQNRVI